MVMARTVATALFFEMVGRHPVEQSRKAVEMLTTWLLIENSALVIDLLASSGLMVACKSKRCSGRKRATIGAACPLLNSSLGGVRRVTTGCAKASVPNVSKPMKAGKGGRGEFFFIAMYFW